MSWPIEWPAEANVDSADEDLVALAEEYAGDSMRMLTLGRVGGDEFSAPLLGTRPVSATGAYAGGVLAWEFLKLLTSKKCRLPSGVTNMARQGVTMELTRDMFEGGLTSIPEVDAYIRQWNPNGLKVKPQVYSPDKPGTPKPVERPGWFGDRNFWGPWL